MSVLGYFSPALRECGMLCASDYSYLGEKIENLMNILNRDLQDVYWIMQKAEDHEEIGCKGDRDSNKGLSQGNVQREMRL